jgi:hypothetical protein
MPSPSMNVRNILSEAERAAGSGDLASAEELLREAAVLQEAELGPFHPDLANTLNNLAVVAERTGRADDAEAFYRRAVAIASASLPPDDPMVAASRQNLEDFCRANGRPIDTPAISGPAAGRAPAPPPSELPRSEPTSSAPPPPPAPLPPPTPTSIPTASSPQPPVVSRRASRAPAVLAVGAVGLIIAALLVARSWSPRREASPAPAAQQAPAPAVEPAPPPAPPAPVDTTAAPNVDKAPAPAPSSTGISLATVLLCRSLSTTDWRCDPVGDSVEPGAIVLYTRVRSPRDGVIVHRWYRGDALRKTAQLRISANNAEGYRTFSRQTVDRGDWRVEVRTAEGDLLHEQRLAVR